MKCNPRVIQKVVPPPPRKITCFNCGCKIKPGRCHCGADVWWALDPYEGWRALGEIATVRIGRRK